MRIVLNGESRDLAAGVTVAEAVDVATAGGRGSASSRDRDGAPSHSGLAVAVDGEVLPRGEWELTRLHEGQRVEVVRAVQGGA
jgi:sulfur carrier protein